MAFTKKKYFLSIKSNLGVHAKLVMVTNLQIFIYFTIFSTFKQPNTKFHQITSKFWQQLNVGYNDKFGMNTKIDKNDNLIVFFPPKLSIIALL